jgi:hypothetical protein
MDTNVLQMDAKTVAVYLRILSLQWGNGPLPGDPATLSRILTSGAFVVTEAELEAMLQAVLGACLEQDENGRIFNARLADERDEWERKRASFAARGSKGGKASRKRPRSAPGKATGGASLALSTALSTASEQEEAVVPFLSSSLPCPIPSPPTSPPQGGEPPAKKKPKPPTIEIPPELRAIGIDEEELARRKASTKAKKLTAWASELKALTRGLADFGPGPVLATWEAAIASGWQGIAYDYIEARAKPQRGRNGPAKNVDPAMMVGAHRPPAAPVLRPATIRRSKPPAALRDDWGRMVNALRGDLDREEFANWIAPLSLCFADSRRFVLLCPNASIGQTLHEGYRQALGRALDACGMRGREILFTWDE